MKKGLIVAITAAVLLGLGAVLFIVGADDDSEDLTSSTPSEQTENTQTNSSASGTALEGSDAANQNDTNLDGSTEQDQNLTIDMSNFEFSVEEITASPGDTITVELTNSGGTHNFMLDEFGVESDTINTGETALVTFTVPEDASGQYEYYCGVSNHRELGMVGTLTVN